MEATSDILKKCVKMNDDYQMKELLKAGLDPNYDGGWILRLAARHGSFAVVRTLIQHGANPHLLGELGASALQLAVFSDLHWTTDKWSFLLSCYNSSQLADGAAVALVFKNIPALNKILQTGRCNAHIPTTLTGKTLKQLAKGYKLDHLLVPEVDRWRGTTNLRQENYVACSPRNNNLLTVASSPVPSTSSPSDGQLSPSVARFFDQAASTTPRSSPVSQWSLFSLQ